MQAPPTKTGNHCGHQPAAPRLFVPPAGHQARPGILVRLIERLQRYYRRPQEIPSLNRANGSNRQQRSERREACLVVLSVLLHYLDLVTLRVGIPKAGKITGMTVKFIAQRADLGKRRVERALADLATANLITVHPYVKRHADGRYTGFGAIRTVSPKLFAIYGLGGWLKIARQRSSQRQRRSIKQAGQAATARRDLLLGNLEKKTAPPAPSLFNRTVELVRLMTAFPEVPVESLVTRLDSRS